VRGVCQAKVGAACSGGACRACDESGTCASKTTICAPQGDSTVLVGSGQFGCTAPNTCVAGMCRACTQPPAQPALGVPIVAPSRLVDCNGNVDCGFNTNSLLSKGSCVAGKCVCQNGYTGASCPLACPDTSASWSIDLLLASPALGTLTTNCGSNGGANVTFSTGAGCQVVWVPSVGAGVDCSMRDSLLSAGETVIITLVPATNKLRLGFGNFVEGASRGKAKLVLAGMRRRQAAGTEYNITTAALEINQVGIVGVEISGVTGSFAVTKIDSIDTTSITANTTVLETTSATGNDTGVSTMDVGTEGERGFIERLQDGFRGEDDVYLGGFIGVLLFIALMAGATCVAVYIYVRQKKRLAAHQARSGGVKTVSDQHEMVSFVDKERERSASNVSLQSLPYAKIPAMGESNPGYGQFPSDDSAGAGAPQYAKSFPDGPDYVTSFPDNGSSAAITLPTFYMTQATIEE
jgi:hypothetical protein